MTLTVYHREGLTRQVVDRAYFEVTRTRGAAGMEKLGTEFLAVIPCKSPAVFPGDKLLPGVGPEVSHWRELDVDRFPELMTVSQVAQRYFNGELCHVEAR